MSKENRKKRLLRRCDKEGTVRNTFEKILQDKLSKLEQIEFIEKRAEGNLQKLQLLRKDLDRYLLELNDWKGARTYFNRFAQRLNPDFDAIDEINGFSELLDEHIDDADSNQSEKVQSIGYPDPKKIAAQYHIEKGSKHKEYTAEQIAPVMEVTKTHIEENPGISTIYGHIKAIRDKCNSLSGKREAKSNWIKFYAEKAGLENK